MKKDQEYQKEDSREENVAEEEAAREAHQEQQEYEEEKVNETTHEDSPEKDAYYDKYIRLYADFENYKRRTARERVEMMGQASAELVKELLPVMDDFERALEALEKEGDEEAFKGVDLIYQKMKRTLEQKGLKPMDAEGQEFDPEHHEALTKVQAPSKDMKGKVIHEVEKGYYLNDRIIRHAKVIVGQ